MADYPGTIYNPGSLTDNVDYPKASDINTLRVEMTAVQTGIGTDLATSPAQGNVLYYNGSSWVKLAPGTSGQVLSTSGAGANPLWITVATGLPINFKYGCEMSNNVSDATNDIDFTAGNWRDSTNVADMAGTAMTKRLDANWAAGSGNGFRNSGAAITNTTYHIYLVAKALGANPEYYAHTSTTIATVITALQAETGGSAYIYARRIGSIVRAGAAILGFTQRGDNFTLKAPVLDQSVVNLGTSSVTYALASVPLGIVVKAIITGYVFKTATFTQVYVRALTETDAAASYNTNANITDPSATNGGSVTLEIYTDTSAQIAARAAAASTTFMIITRGWVDIRNL